MFKEFYFFPLSLDSNLKEISFGNNLEEDEELFNKELLPTFADLACIAIIEYLNNSEKFKKETLCKLNLGPMG